jgi:hypothetical protein
MVSISRAGLGLVALALSCLSCKPSPAAVADGDDPLAALTVQVQSARYDGPYWTRQAHRSSRLWQAAKAYCRANRDRELPNCQPIALVERWEQPALLPVLPAPPPAPPAVHPEEPSYVATDVAALKAWEERLAARGKAAAPKVRQ